VTRFSVTVAHPTPWLTVRRVVAIDAIGDCLTPARIPIAHGEEGRLLRHVPCGRRLPAVYQCPACRHYLRIVADQHGLPL
jgi:hypothetical protein